MLSLLVFEYLELKHLTDLKILIVVENHSDEVFIVSFDTGPIMHNFSKGMLPALNLINCTNIGKSGSHLEIHQRDEFLKLVT